MQNNAENTYRRVINVKLMHKDTINANKNGGYVHLGIITIPVTMLRGNKETLKDLRQRLYGLEFSDLIVADFSNVAQECNIYSDYVAKAVTTFEQDHTYFGVAIYGSKKKVNKLTGFIPLLR